MTDLQMLAIDSLVPHPDNPRLQLREDVVERIAAEIERYNFGREHALLVRPKDGAYQILSGHHRLEAARRAGLTEVPCWLRDLDDGEAFMQLVLANTQGELSPLEIGMHALAWPGEQKDYAERTGFGKSYISQLRSAAEVARVYSSKLTDLSDKAKHLYEISKAPESSWPVLVERLIANEWTVTDTSHYVGTVREFDIPPHHAYWLPPADVARHYLATREFAPKTVARLIAAADQTFAWIAENGREGDEAAFREWLRSNAGGKSWQPRAVAEYLAQLIAGQFIVKGWHQGDWREHAGKLEDGSVSLLLTDPPYGMSYQSDYRLDRRKDRKHDHIAGDETDAAAELAAMLDAFMPKLAANAHVLVFCGWAGEPDMRDVITKAGYTIRGSLVWDKQATGMGDPETTFAPAHERILHAVKGSPVLYRRAPDLLSHRRCDSARHPTEKPVPLLRELIEATTAEGQLVADPFGGVASTPDAAKASGRRWWGCELEEKYWQAGEERLS